MNIPIISKVISKDILKHIDQLSFDMSEWNQNPRIGKDLSKTVLSGGKRLRPLLLFLSADLFGLCKEKASLYARAVELVHASTLAHDDVIDAADLRRGKPSINAVTSNKQAVLAGDYLLAYVLKEVSSQGNCNVVIELANVIGDLAEGEWLQIENSQHIALTRAHVEEVARKKTGSVLKWCTVVPAILMEKPPHVINDARLLGEYLGIAFQLTDDILDLKRSDGCEFQDMKNGVINSVIFEAISKKAEKDCLNIPEYAEKMSFTQKEIDHAITASRSRLNSLLEKAENLLKKLTDQSDGENLDRQLQTQHSFEALIQFLRIRI
ncbi:MAG: hypothetical protein CMP10_11825 [Zetaproteobacteria bacterium]|nr:hypothetical protein [Pseudobdellovibrionaceae bacterium]